MIFPLQKQELTMKTISFSVLTASLALATALTFFACDGKSSLVGRWVLVEGPTYGNPEEMELLSDGTGITDNNGGATWKVENGRFYLNPSKGRYNAAAWNYEVSGSKLTLTKDDGTVLEYIDFKKMKSTGSANLVGRWDLVGGFGAEEMEFSNDGSGIIDKKEIRYKTENGHLYILTPSGHYDGVLNYEVSGSMLTFTGYEGVVLQKYMDLKKIKPPSFTNFTDSRNSKSYKTVKMPDGKVWFAENLNYAAEGSRCYDYNEKNCQKYGRLYDWAAAMDACPKGWHLPDEEEWNGLPAKAKHLKAKGWNGTDAFGFAALPGGLGYSDDSFGGAGVNGYWWSTSGYGSGFAYFWFGFHTIESTRWSQSNKNSLFSVRCLKD
jgi:uncharacterized protein (TIGR02145 family)